MNRQPRRGWPVIFLGLAAAGAVLASIALMIAAAWAAEYPGQSGSSTATRSGSATYGMHEYQSLRDYAPERGEPGAAAATDA
jgi:hypothetical protein